MPRKPIFGIRAASIALLAMQPAPLEAAGERSKVEPIASETISISVSVAARYQLGAAGGPRDNDNSAAMGSRQLCLDGNAAPGLLPVRLRRLSESSPAPAETAIAPGEGAIVMSIAPCTPREGRSEARPALSDGGQGVQVMLIQPE